MEYLDIANDTVGIFNAVNQVYVDKNNRELWELYLSIKPEKSFNDWKSDIVAETKSVCANGGTKNADETNKIVNKSEDILKGFIPKDE